MVKVTTRSGEIEGIATSLPSKEKIIESLERVVQNEMNKKANEKGYDNIITASLRAANPASPFYEEGVIFSIWMDEVWAYCYQVLADVEAGNRSIPTPDELIAELNANVPLVI